MPARPLLWGLRRPTPRARWQGHTQSALRAIVAAPTSVVLRNSHASALKTPGTRHAVCYASRTPRCQVALDAYARLRIFHESHDLSCCVVRARIRASTACAFLPTLLGLRSWEEGDCRDLMARINEWLAPLFQALRGVGDGVGAGLSSVTETLGTGLNAATEGVSAGVNATVNSLDSGLDATVETLGSATESIGKGLEATKDSLERGVKEIGRGAKESIKELKGLFK